MENCIFLRNAGNLPDEEARRDWLRGRTIAIPGKLTSAYLAAQLYLGADFRHLVVPFDEIFEKVTAGKAHRGW